MSDPPPRDPKSADSAAPNAAAEPKPTRPALPDATSAGQRSQMSSNLRYLMKQPSTPWVTFDRDSKAAKEEVGGPGDGLDGGWDEPSADGRRSSPPAALVPSRPPPAPLAPAPVPPAFDVPPPPAHLMAVVDQVLAQSRPPPADPGPAGQPPPALPPARLPDLALPPVLAPPLDPVAPAHVAPLADAAAPADASPPDVAHPSRERATHGDVAVAIGVRKKSPAVLVAFSVVVLAILALVVGVAFVVKRSPASSTTAPLTTVSVASAPASAPVPASSPSPSPTPGPASPASAPVARVDDAPTASPPAPSSSAASASAVDPKTGALRASYLTIPRSLARHFVFLDGKRMLGNGARSFPVKCGEHTLAIDDRKATRVINIECGAEYIVTN